MEANYLEEKKPNTIVAAYRLITGLIKLVVKTFFYF